MPAKKKPHDPWRNADLATIHMAAKQLFGDVTAKGEGRADYEAWLQRHTGKSSAGKLTRAERIEFVKMLRREGLIPERMKGGQTTDRPTHAQWAKLGGLARSMGWHKALEDHRLQAFVKRTANVSSTRFLTRDQASKVITGLERWRREQMDGADDAMS